MSKEDDKPEGQEEEFVPMDAAELDKTPSALDAAGKKPEDEDPGEPKDKLAAGEEEEGKKPDGEEDDDKKEHLIPKTRFDEALTKARRREEQLQEKIKALEGQNTSAKQTSDVAKMQEEIEALQDEYEDLIMDGKKDAARAVRKKVDKMRDDLYEVRTSAKTDQARNAAIEQLNFDAALANVEATYGKVNPDSPDFDEDTTEEVAVLLEAFVAKGMARHTALTKAVKYVLGEPPKAEGENDAEAIRKQRAKDARKAAADAAEKTPASAAKVGLDSDKAGGSGKHGIDVLKLTQEQFDKLDEETIAELRGDFNIPA
jgi:hypothetical protein